MGIDWWDGDIREDDDDYDNIPECELYNEIYYLRMRHINEPVICPSWGGTCICLTDTGCSFRYEDRPLGCQTLVPSSDFRCSETSYSKFDCVRDWINYQDIMWDIYKNAPKRFHEKDYKGGKC